ncbi:MAG TPA: FadR family transcriptional regulator [Propionibacterium sp.]|jgi:DNA-binding FadR family transcriptional regulator|nr:FadR family transcriptional regulator [Propionibacterium sp.]
MSFASQSGSQKRAESVARAIEDRIVELGWPVGHLIGSEQSLMAEYGASRGVLREAVRLLEHHGTARMRRGPGGGLVVDAPSAHAVRRSASLLLQYQRLDLASLVAARAALELTCFDLLAERAGGPGVSGQLLAAIQLEGAPSDAQPLGHGFHVVLARRAANAPLALFTQTLIEMHGEEVDGTPQDPEFQLLDHGACQSDHQAIHDALATGDWTGARAQLVRHLARLTEATLSALGRDELMA